MLQKLIQQSWNFLVAVLGTAIVSVVVRVGAKSKVQQRTGGWQPINFSAK